MASKVLRLRPALSLSSTLLNHFAAAPATISSSHSLLLHTPISPQPPQTSSSTAFLSPLPRILSPSPIHCRCFHSTPPSLSASRSYNDDDKIDPDTILFEGCDYKHWLITMDFPKDPQPSAEEMVETYVQTLAKVVGSVEEAKKRMYACSTTTYHGFQAEIDEETSKKFEGMPGVVFVLPDSYIDPVNKEYGGDKYINGTIIPRPPPVQYGRNTRRNRNYEQRPRGSMPNYQMNPVYEQQRSMQGDGRSHMPQQNFPPQQNYGPPQQNYGPPQLNYGPPQQNYGPPRQGERRNPIPTNGLGQQAGGSPTYQDKYIQGNYNLQEQRGYPHGDQRDYAPQEQRVFTGDTRNYAPPRPLGGALGQGGFESGSHGSTGTYGPGASGSYGQGKGSGLGPGYTAHGDNAKFPQPPDGQHNIMQGEQMNSQSMGQTGMKQGGY
ncbi:hypothetical protein Nepgr_026910 [Nepenthes gracilis]|uniref:MORF/ORRM1/DAG-like MORF domain-containing protein n=1 Tax=Nepenthes gracilis TaxID=150966 RepID=A0AAD3TAR0_NEPGR|nr:hypothetical protein Nepgr_026910 [Nepenthes gracilis]